MKNKPLIFTVISFLCLIEPLIKVLYFKATTHYDFAVIIENIRSRNSFMDVVDFWFVFPIAGLLITKLRRWTYFAFMGVMTYIIYNIATYEKYTWPYNSSTPPMYHYVVALAAAAVFIGFLFPQVRRPFFDRRMRWWELQRRYNVDLACKLYNSSHNFTSHILNISQSGAFLADSAQLKVGDRFHMEFDFLGRKMETPVEVVHRSETGSQRGYGIKFKKSFVTAIKMARVISVIKHSRHLLGNSKAAA